MKTVVYLLSAIVLTSMAVAVAENYSQQDKSELSCNSTEFSQYNEIYSKIGLVDASCMSGDQEEGILSVENYSDTDVEGVNFTGLIQTPTPCYTVAYDVSEEDEGHYAVDIVTVPDGSEVCIQCIGGITYEAKFEAEEPFTLHIKHNGESLESINSS